MNKLFWLVELLSGRKSMKGVFVASGIGIVVLLALLVWGAVAGIGFVWNNAPRWLEGGERIAVETVRRAQETLPAVTGKVAASAGVSVRRWPHTGWWTW